MGRLNKSKQEVSITSNNQFQFQELEPRDASGVGAEFRYASEGKWLIPNIVGIFAKVVILNLRVLVPLGVK